MSSKCAKEGVTWLYSRQCQGMLECKECQGMVGCVREFQSFTRNTGDDNI